MTEDCDCTQGSKCQSGAGCEREIQDRLHSVGMKMDPKWEENVFTNKVFILVKVQGKKKKKKKEKKKTLNLDGGVEAFSPLCSLPRVLLGRLVKVPRAEFSVGPRYSSFFSNDRLLQSRSRKVKACRIL